MDDPLVRIAGTTAQYYHQDGLGSVVGVTNGTGGTDATARYDAYGNKIASTGIIPQYGYTGREPDDTGLVYYRARYYDPTIGRFVQREPNWVVGRDLVPYAFVGNNPIVYVDKNGLKRIRFEITTFIASDKVNVPFVGTFAGDARDFQAGSSKFRTQQIFEIETDPKLAPNPIISSSRAVGETLQINPTTGQIINRATASVEGLTVTGSRDSQGNVIVQVGTHTRNPLATMLGINSPAIDNSFTIKAPAGSEEFQVTGTLDGFPSVEAYATLESGGTLPVFGFHPNSIFGSGALLPGLGDRSVNVGCSSGYGCAGDPGLPIPTTSSALDAGPVGPYTGGSSGTVRFK